MLAERDHRARLRTFGALGMLRDETHLVANGERFERAVHDTVAMEIDLAAIGTQNEAAILRGQEPRDPSMVGHRVQLDVAASQTNVIFQQPASCVEGVADRDIDILMRMVSLGIAPDDNLVSRNFEVDAHSKQITLLAPGVLVFDNDAARYDPVKEAFELLGALTYSSRDGIRRVHMAESNLKRQLHRTLHSVSTSVGDGEPFRIDPAQSREVILSKNAAALPLGHRGCGY